MKQHLKTFEHTCEFKQRYETSQEAKQIVRGMRRNKKLVFEYRCNVCGFWHLSSKKMR